MIFALLSLTLQTSDQNASEPSLGAKVWTQADFPEAASNQVDPAKSPHDHHGKWQARDTYPPEALRRGEQGRVVAKATVGIDGRATRCWIVQSSGSESLDKQTCSIVIRRVHWKPAMDAKGQPIVSEATIPTRWVLPNR
jgi:periplasmic protein TonB